MKNKQKYNQYVLLGGRASAEARLAFIHCVASNHDLKHRGLTLLTGHSPTSVAAWLTECSFARHQGVPAWAFDRLRLEMKAVNVKGSR